MSDRGPLWALVPVKPFAEAKSRLARALDAEARAAFARSMLEHVLVVLAASSEIAGVMVVTRSDEVAEFAATRGAVAERDAETEELALVVDAALSVLAERGAAGALVLMSDLPLLDVSDIDALARLMRDHDLVASPDARGESTNALGLSPPDRMKTSFGVGGSFERHLAAARRAGLRVAVHRSPTLELDVDVPDDLARARAGAIHRP